MAVAQLVERSPSETTGPQFNPVMGKFYLLSTILKRQKEKKKRPEITHFKKTSPNIFSNLIINSLKI